MERITFFFGHAAKYASLTSGISCISAFVIFLLLSLFSRKTSPIRKQALYNYCSIYLLLIGIYQIFLYLTLQEQTDANQALLYLRLSHFFGLPTVPIFLNVVLILTVGGFRELMLSDKLKIKWKKITQWLWKPIWVITAIYCLIHLIDIVFTSDIYLMARNKPIENSFIPLIAPISNKYTLFNFNPVKWLWYLTFVLTSAMTIGYLFRSIWFDKHEGPGGSQKTFRMKLEFLIAGIKDKSPTVKWIKTFSFFLILHMICTTLQGVVGYHWTNSFPIVVYSASFLTFAFAFILIGETVEARENIIAAYTSSYGSRMVSVVAHEMGTPLFIIRGFITRLQNDFQKRIKKSPSGISDQELRKYILDLKKVQGALKRLGETTDALKVKAGIFRTQLRHVAINDLIEEASVAENFNSNGKEFKLVVSKDPTLEGAIVDPEQMRLILRNLIENAVDALPKKDGVIQVSSKLRKGQVFIYVEDNGTGIPQKYLGRVQEPFFSTKLKGTGLGLPIVLGFLKEIRGTLKIDSVDGVGTKFEIAFPCKA